MEDRVQGLNSVIDILSTGPARYTHRLGATQLMRLLTAHTHRLARAWALDKASRVRWPWATSVGWPGVNYEISTKLKRYYKNSTAPKKISKIVPITPDTDDWIKQSRQLQTIGSYRLYVADRYLSPVTWAIGPVAQIPSDCGPPPIAHKRGDSCP